MCALRFCRCMLAVVYLLCLHILQLYMVRTMLESLFSERGGKRPPRRDLDPKHLEEIDSFHKMSFFWSYLLNFTGLCLRV